MCDIVDSVLDSILSLGFCCTCNTHIPALDFCLERNSWTSSFAWVNSLAGTQVQSVLVYPFQWTRYSVLLLLRSQLCTITFFLFLPHHMTPFLSPDPYSSPDHFLGTNVLDLYCSPFSLFQKPIVHPNREPYCSLLIVLFSYCSPDSLFTYLGDSIVPSLLSAVLSCLVMVAALMYISWLISRVGP